MDTVLEQQLNVAHEYQFDLSLVGKNNDRSQRLLRSVEVRYHEVVAQGDTDVRRCRWRTPSPKGRR